MLLKIVGCTCRIHECVVAGEQGGKQDCGLREEADFVDLTGVKSA